MAELLFDHLRLCHFNMLTCSVQFIALIQFRNSLFSPQANLSCEADASGGKPGQRHGCSCRHLPVGGGQIAALRPWQRAIGPPRGAGGRIVTETRVQHRTGPTGRWVRDDQEPLDKSTGSDWPGQNLPREG